MHRLRHSSVDLKFSVSSFSPVPLRVPCCSLAILEKRTDCNLQFKSKSINRA